jgi:3-hydroxyisobutyrate dehydrogenase-like beta-hydroxyacid dehydrogenase
MKVSIVGLGIMGTAIARRLLEAEHEVTVTNRTRAKADPLIEAGARWAQTPAEAASDAEVVITMVTDPSAVIAVTLGSSGILSTIPATSVHAEMSTVAPASADAMTAEYRKMGRRFVQAPVLGSRTQIEQSTLLILAGGSAQDIDRCSPIWNAFAKRVWTLNSPEQASALKLACNMMIAQMILGLGQSLIFARTYGIAATEFLDVIGESALASPMYKSKGASLVSGTFTPNFVVNNLLKDVNLATDAARAKGNTMPFNSLAGEMLSRAAASGLGDEDYSAAVKILAADAGVKIA